MADVTVKGLEEMESVFGGAMVRVRASLGVSAFGMQVINLPPGSDLYPSDYDGDGQEEVYTVLRGLATLIVGDQRYPLRPGTFARVGAGQLRRFVPGEEGVQILCLGAFPGQVYEPPRWSELGGDVPGSQRVTSEGS